MAPAVGLSRAGLIITCLMSSLDHVPEYVYVRCTIPSFACPRTPTTLSARKAESLQNGSNNRENQTCAPRIYIGYYMDIKILRSYNIYGSYIHILCGYNIHRELNCANFCSACIISFGGAGGQVATGCHLILLQQRIAL